MFGLHHMSSNYHSMLVSWFVVVGIAYMKYSSVTVQTANLHVFSNSNCMILYQPSCKPVVLNNYVLMFGLHHMGAIVTVCILVGCLVVIVCFKITGGATLHSSPYSNCMCFLPTLLYTQGVGETSVDACVAPHGLHWHSVYTGRLLRCH